MTVTLYAQPYDLEAKGFYFEDYESYKEKSKDLKNSLGDPVEEFEIQFIDGDRLDCELANAYGINQANLETFLVIVDSWEDWEKMHLIIAVVECGHSFDPDTVSPDDFDVDIYGVASLKELAERFVDDGYFGDIPESLQFYIDYEAIARDLAMDYVETNIAGDTIVYRCG